MMDVVIIVAFILGVMTAPFVIHALALHGYWPGFERRRRRR